MAPGMAAPTIEVLEQIVSERMRYYSAVRRRSALQNQPPRKFLDCWQFAVEVDRFSPEPSSTITRKPED